MKNKFSKITIFFALFIIISVTFMNQVFDFLEAKFGRKPVANFFSAMIVAVGLIFLIILIKKSSNFIKTIFSILLLIIGLVFAWHIKIPAEKIHILEYGILGWLAAKDLIVTNRKFRMVIMASIFTLAVGLCDEFIQKILPYRVFDLRDIVYNGLGGIWGVGLYLLK